MICVSTVTYSFRFWSTGPTELPTSGLHHEQSVNLCWCLISLNVSLATHQESKNAQIYTQRILFIDQEIAPLKDSTHDRSWWHDNMYRMFRVSRSFRSLLHVCSSGVVQCIRWRRCLEPASWDVDHIHPNKLSVWAGRESEWSPFPLRNHHRFNF